MKTLQHDIILLKLEEPLIFSKDVNKACLPTEDFDPSKSVAGCYVSGWGSLKKRLGPSSKLLHWVNMPLVPNSKCNLAYRGIITKNMICMGYPEGGKDSCRADSGGPLVCPDEKRQAIITGVVSFGVGCGDPRYPGVYTKVVAYLKWIRRNID